MNEETQSNDDPAQAQDTGSTSESDSVLTDAEKERIRSEEWHASEEREFRQQVRQEIRGTSIWARVLAMLKLEPGVSEEIAADSSSTKQALVVFVIASSLSGGLMLIPLSLLLLPLSLAFTAIIILLFSLVSRLFATEVPPYSHWFRAQLFALAPIGLGVIPFIGSIVGFIYVIVLEIVVIRDLSRISTGQAIATWLIVMLIPIAMLVAVTIAGISVLGGIGLLGLSDL